jgi:hypothetical protein
VCIRDWGRFRQENRDMRGLENRYCVDRRKVYVLIKKQER